jgi:hypothetical protein
VDLFHIDEPDKKVAECCTVSGCAGEPFHGMQIAPRLFKVNVGPILDQECLLFVTMKDNMSP